MCRIHPGQPKSLPDMEPVDELDTSYSEKKAGRVEKDRGSARVGFISLAMTTDPALIREDEVIDRKNSKSPRDKKAYQELRSTLKTCKLHTGLVLLLSSSTASLASFGSLRAIFYQSPNLLLALLLGERSK